MTEWFSWGSDGVRYATVAGTSPDQSLLLTPRGFNATRGTVSLRLVNDERGLLPLSDFPHTGLPQPRVLSIVAWAALESRLRDYGRVARAAMPDGNEFVLWSPHVVADCLDEQASVILETLSGFRKLLEPVFRVARIPSDCPFLVKGFESQDVWVGGEFKEAILRAKLSGSEFQMRARAV
jgi:hypothetical protein